MFDLRSLVEQDTTLKRVGAGWFSAPCPFCGGVDRFVLHLDKGGWRWLCRQCGDGKYKDAASYLMKRDGLSYAEAMKALGEPLRQQRPRIQPAPVEPPKPVYELPSLQWQTAAFKELDRAMTALDVNQQAQDYLSGRGISRSSMFRFLLGYQEVNGRPAIVIPNLSDINAILAVKYRFFDDQQPRYSSRKGSKPLLYNLIDCVNHDTLIIVEGELNAISIKQALPFAAGVVSTGSEGIGPVAETALKKLAAHYTRVVVWMDEEDTALKVGGYTRASVTLKTPFADGVKCDANEMLQRGILHEFITRALSKEYKTR